MHFIGIDIGTTSICGVVYDFSTGRWESTSEKNEATIASGRAWEKIQNPDKIIGCVMGIIQKFEAKYEDIGGIGITGQMHGILYVDQEGQSVGPFYTWLDNRGNLLYENSKTYVEYLVENTDYFLSSGYGLLTHFYNITNGMVPEGAVKLCTIMDYAVMKLTGRKTPLTDFSNAASLGFFDTKKNAFDLEALRSVKVDASILPEVAESATLAGYYNNIPLYSALGDNQASFIGSVKDRSKSIHITIGTSSQISIYSEDYIRMKSIETRPFPWGGYILVGAALCGGQSLSMLKSFFQRALSLFNNDSIGDIDFYDKMQTINSSGRENEALAIKTLFNGTRTDPLVRGSISNITTSNFTPEAIILGFMRGICNELYDFYEEIPCSVKDDKVLLIGSGNAIEKNNLLCRILEEKFGYKITKSKYNESAAFGASISAIVGGKYIADYALLHEKK